VNTIITPNWVTKDIAIGWMNEITLVNQFDRQWEDQWTNRPEGAKIGDTVQVRLPQRFTVTEGQALQQQAILNQTVPITINHQYNVAMGWSTRSATLEIEEVQRRYTKPAGTSLANKADVQCGQEVYRAVWNSIGTPGTAITSDGTYTDGIAKLLNQGTPDDIIAVLDPKSQSRISQANFALFNPGAVISEMFKKGRFSVGSLGIKEWFRDPNMPTHTTGTFTTATPIVSGANQTGTTLSVSGMGTYALKAGDVFTLDGVYSVNALSYNDTNDLQQFVLTQDVSGTTTGTLTFQPPIITSGQLQTVTNAPAASAAISFLGATGTVSATMAATRSKQSLIFNPEAFAFVMVDLDDDLAGAQVGVVRDKQAKVKMRWAYQYNIQTDQKPARADMLIGIAPIQPVFGMRAWS